MLLELLVLVRSTIVCNLEFQGKDAFVEGSKRGRRGFDLTMGVGWNRDIVFARRGWLPALLIVLGAGALSLVLIGRQIWLADWGIVDDHEIFDFLGNRLHLPFSEIVSTVLGKTEVGSLQGRFRPVYYFLRVLETVAWGRDVHLWYGFHTLAFAVFLGAVWWVLFRILGLLPSALCMVPIAFVKFWGAIWGRLGPSEIYAVPAMGLMVLGCYEIFCAPSALRRNLGCVALTVGTLIAVGSKETLLPLAGFTLFVVALAVVDRRLTAPSSLVAGAVTVLFSSFVGWIVLRELAVAGADIYGNSVSPVARLMATLSLMRPFGAIFTVAAVVTIVVVARSILRSRQSISSVESVGVLGTLCFLLGLFVAQELAYGGSLPTGARYDFPGMLIPVCFVLFIGCVSNLRVRASGRKRQAENLALGFGVAIGIVFLFTGGIKGVRNSADLIETNIVKTKEFSGEFAAIVSRARTDPAAPIILEAYGPGAYEPVFSLQRYLQSAGLQNPVAVRLHPDPLSSGPLYDGLEKTLRRLQDDGGSSFARLADLPSGAACLSIGINGEADQHCSGFRVRT